MADDAKERDGHLCAVHAAPPTVDCVVQTELEGAMLFSADHVASVIEGTIIKTTQAMEAAMEAGVGVKLAETAQAIEESIDAKLENAFTKTQHDMSELQRRVQALGSTKQSASDVDRDVDPAASSASGTRLRPEKKKGKKDPYRPGSMKLAKEYQGIKLGMLWGTGSVQEIYPGIDRFAVHVRRPDNAVEIQWHSISASQR